MKLLKYIRLLIVLNLCGCVVHPVNAPSTSAVTGSIQVMKAGDKTIDYKGNRALEYF